MEQRLDDRQRQHTMSGAAHASAGSSTAGFHSWLRAVARAPTVTPPPTARECLGRYSLLRQIGDGGMGIVYEARDTALDRRVALKVLRSSLTGDREHNERFMREARTGAALNHPCIAAVYDVGEHSGRLYIAMEYIDGATLDEHVGIARLTVDAALEIAFAIAAALQCAHASRVVHRDLKPLNVMVTRDGGVKLLDFGLAKRSEDSSASARVNTPLTETGRIMGSAGYMSPEQVRGRHVDASTDVFAWATIVYEMLTGALAFPGESGAERVAATLRDEPRELPRVVAMVGTQLGDLLRRALSKEPQERPTSDALVASLHRYRADSLWGRYNRAS